MLYPITPFDAYILYEYPLKRKLDDTDGPAYVVHKYLLILLNFCMQGGDSIASENPIENPTEFSDIFSGILGAISIQ